jgi:adenosylhomocysteine nucleosidase
MTRIGIIAALPKEFGRLAEIFNCTKSESIGPRVFSRGSFGSTELVLVVSNVGKVAAATTTTLLIDRFDVESVVCVGVAGGVGEGVGIGDLVIAEHLVQHDMDCKGVLGFSRYVIPSLAVSQLPTNSELTEAALAAAESVVNDVSYRDAVLELAKREPVMRYGVVASGDQFVDQASDRQRLTADIPGLLAVEMEGAAIGQVCVEHGVPFVVARVISDTVTGDAAGDFATFIEKAAAVASARFARDFIERISLPK